MKKTRVWTFCKCTQASPMRVPGKLNEKKDLIQRKNKTMSHTAQLKNYTTVSFC